MTDFVVAHWRLLQHCCFLSLPGIALLAIRGVDGVSPNVELVVLLADNAGGFYAPSPAGRIDGGVIFGA